MSFRLTCCNCSCSVHYDPEMCQPIGIVFKKGTPNTIDRMVITCRICHTRQEVGIAWPLDLMQEKEK